jgi:electron transport complex protein RnfD
MDKQMSNKSQKSSERFFTDNLLILAGISVIAYYYYGFRAIVILAVAVFTSLICGAVIAKISKKSLSEAAIPDVVTGFITGLMFPAQTSYLTVFIAALFGALVCRAVFGGFMNESVSPSAVSFLFIYYAFGGGLLLFPPIMGELSLSPNVYPETLVPSYFADILSYGVTEAAGADVLFGRLPFFLGGGAAVLLLIGAVFFVARRDISLSSLIISLCLFAAISLISGQFGLHETIYFVAALLFPTLFCIMPTTRKMKTLHGKILYGIICGLSLGMFVLYAKSPAAGFFTAVLVSPLAVFLEENDFSFMSFLPKKLSYVKLEKL